MVSLSLLVLAMAVALSLPSSFLVVDNPKPSDSIVVLAGDFYGTRYSRGVELLRLGYGRRLIVDISSGSTAAAAAHGEWQRNLLSDTDPALKREIIVCTVSGRSTRAEVDDVTRCLPQPAVHSVVLVTSEFHSRRALAIFSRRLPQYRWSVAAAADTRLFAAEWWRRRVWTQTAVREWTKLLWWHVVRQWSKLQPVPSISWSVTGSG